MKDNQSAFLSLGADLDAIYERDDEQFSGENLQRLEELFAKWEGALSPASAGWSEKDALLITYADSIVSTTKGEAPLRSLHAFLSEQVKGAFSFLHLLPFYPYSSDDGFSVIDFRRVREDLGNWLDVEALSKNYRLVFDGVINHVSQESAYVQGDLSGDLRYKNFCYEADPHQDYSMVVRPRTSHLLSAFQGKQVGQGGEEIARYLWTTFSRDQVDLNYENPAVLFEILDVLLFYTSKGASMLRLDAVTYLWKELGTSCANHPKTHRIIQFIRAVFDELAPWVILLSETNVPHEQNITYWGQRGEEAQVIYNFALPPLVLHSLHSGSAAELSKWARQLEPLADERALLNFTASHDGIGLRAVESILSSEQIEVLVKACRDGGGEVSMRSDPSKELGEKESPYELNISYFDAVSHPKEAAELQLSKFILSQAIPMVLAGIPAVYIHSLLATRNDYRAREKTGRARSINRSQLDASAVKQELEDQQSLSSQVCGEITRLLELRAKQPAFHPHASQKILELDPALFALQRVSMDGVQTLTALLNVSSEEVAVPREQVVSKDSEILFDLIQSEEQYCEFLKLPPYSMMWLSHQQR